MFPPHKNTLGLYAKSKLGISRRKYRIILVQYQTVSETYNVRSFDNRPRCTGIIYVKI